MHVLLVNVGLPQMRVLGTLAFTVAFVLAACCVTGSINCFEQGHSGVFDENLNFPIAVHSLNSLTKTNLGSCIFFIYQDRFP